MTSILVLTIEIVLLVSQMKRDYYDKRFSILNASYLFQIYYIVQLPLSSVLATVFKLGITDRRIKTVIEQSARERMLVIVLLGHVFYYIGVKCIKNKRFEISKLSNFRGQDITINITIIALLTAGYTFFHILMKRYGGVQKFIQQIEVWRNVGLVGNSMYTMMISGIMPLALIIFLIHYSESIKRLNILALIILAIIGFASSVPSLVMGFRSYVFNILLMLIVAYNFRIRKIRLNTYLIGTFLFGIYFAAYSLFRASKKSGIDAILYAVNNMGYTMMKLITRSRGSEVVCIQLQKMDGYRMRFDIFYDALVSWIPRKLWPEKPMALNVEYASTFFGSYGIRSGLSGTCVGEFYWEYGIVGLCICMFMLGVIIQLFCNTCLFDVENEKGILMYCVLVWPVIRIAETPSLAFYQIIVLLIATCVMIKFMYQIKIN